MGQRRLFKLKMLYLFYLLTFSFISSAQVEKMQVSTDAHCILNTITNTFIVIDDSTYYWTVSSNNLWTKHDYNFVADELLFCTFKSDYKCVALENGRLLFINYGVGTIYELRNDSLLRIDNSFDHKNQFGSIIFQHQNIIHAQGGYGLFSIKNLFVYYNEELKEWLKMSGQSTIDPRTHHDYQITKNAFYVFGGFIREEEDIAYRYFNDCWKYDFLERKWEKLGDLNLLIQNPREYSNDFQRDLVFSLPYIYKINCSENTVTKYSNPDMPQLTHGYFDKTKKHILLDQIIDGKRYLSVKTSESILYNNIIVSPFYTKVRSTKYVAMVASLALSFVMLVIFFVKREKRVSFLPQSNNIIRENKIVKSDGKYYLRGNLIDDYFEGHDLELLLMFLDHEGEYLNLNILDDVFISSRKYSLSTIKKRREQSIKLIKGHLSIGLNVSKDLIFVEFREHNDKRIKMIKFNPDLLEII